MATHFFDPMLAGRFNGSILVAKDGIILFEKYKGFRNPVRHQDSITAHTAFHLASVSKTFTAMATLKLWQEGKLDIHDPVSKYLAGFPYHDVTVETLLNHRSGLHNYVHYMDKPGVNKHIFLHNADVLQYIIDHPGAREIFSGRADRHFEYSNTNYALLALIIEKVSGMPYPEYLAKTFFQPLGMQDTYVYTAPDSGRSMDSYYQTGRPFRLEFLDQVYGDKNVYSTVRDMYKWDQALRSGQMFSKGVLDSAYAGYSFEKPGQRNYGLGWRMLMIPNGKKLIYHNGWWHGNRTVFVRMMDEDATIIALSNNDYKNVYTAKRLCDLFGDYRQGQGHTNFDEGEPDPADSTGGVAGEPPHEEKKPVAPTVAHTHLHHHVARRGASHSGRRLVHKKKPAATA
ncbi:penicillin-binding protein [Puia dinghuensis]|uniref:Penicillin-binding protein n=2 Tax=Puia dinghuensis TaxID=1792502 RepID=A0A8J2U812_9BACT|nr:penicillin-binding protein [Puia dinghuensis]